MNIAEMNLKGDKYMKAKDVLSHIVDNYYKIVVEVFDKDTQLIKDRYYIKPHAVVSANIPSHVLDKECMIVVHFDSLVISVEE